MRAAVPGFEAGRTPAFHHALNAALTESIFYAASGPSHDAPNKAWIREKMAQAGVDLDELDSKWSRLSSTLGLDDAVHQFFQTRQLPNVAFGLSQEFTDQFGEIADKFLLNQAPEDLERMFTYSVERQLEAMEQAGATPDHIAQVGTLRDNLARVVRDVQQRN
jgi:hypothetical protein